MCEICKVREECDLLSEELEFLEYQKKLRFKQFSEADKARERSNIVLNKIFDLLSTIPRLQEQIEARNEKAGTSIFDMLRRQSDNVH